MADSPAPTAGDDVSKSDRWRVATAQVRATAQWSIGAISATAAVIFGAGPIVASGEFHGGWLRGLFLAACAAIGALAVAYLIWRVATILLPTETRLNKLDPRFKATIEAAGAEHHYLPDGVTSIDQFAKRLPGKSRAARDNGLRIVLLESNVAKRDTRIAELKVVLANIASRLGLVDQQIKVTRDDVRESYEQERTDLLARKAVTDSALANLQTDNLAETAELTSRTAHQHVLEKNRDIYQSARDELLAEYSFWHASNSFQHNTILLAAAPAVAAVAGVGYMLLWGHQPDAPPPPPSPQAEIVMLASTGKPAAVTLWDELGLAACALSDSNNQVPVLLTGGSGIAKDPYKVTTLGLPDECPSISFDVPQTLAVVVRPAEPEEIPIVYNPDE